MDEQARPMEVLPPEKRTQVLPNQSAAMINRANIGEILSLFRDNVGAGNFSIQTLERIKVPSGGATSFRVDTAGGEDSARTLKGYISTYRMGRIYWKSKDAGKKPPDCTSRDGFVGIGDPGGSCKDCPFAAFGSALTRDGGKGAGQACKDIRQVLFLLEEGTIPHLLNVPPTSLKNFTRYTLSLLNTRVPYWGVLTEISLEKVQSQGGIDYAKINFRLIEKMTKEQQEIFRPYHLAMKELLMPSIIDASAYEVEDDEGQGQRPAGGVSDFQPNSDPDIPF